MIALVETEACTTKDSYTIARKTIYKFIPQPKQTTQKHCAGTAKSLLSSASVWSYAQHFTAQIKQDNVWKENQGDFMDHVLFLVMGGILHLHVHFPICVLSFKHICVKCKVFCCFKNMFLFSNDKSNGSLHMLHVYWKKYKNNQKAVQNLKILNKYWHVGIVEDDRSDYTTNKHMAHELPQMSI